MQSEDLDLEVRQLKEDLLILGSMVEEALSLAVLALKDDDLNMASVVLQNDQYVNSRRFELEGDAVAVIATYQPSTRHLRTLISILDLGSELERIGDYAKGISKIHLRAGGLGFPSMLSELHYMAGRVVDMLHRALGAFVQEDIDLARSILLEDDLIDGLYEKIYFEAIDCAIEDAANIERANDVLWIAHNLERAADRTTNICERTIFVVSGESSELFMDRVEELSADVK
jgi:phosphate transport system protein